MSQEMKRLAAVLAMSLGAVGVGCESCRTRHDSDAVTVEAGASASGSSRPQRCVELVAGSTFRVGAPPAARSGKEGGGREAGAEADAPTDDEPADRIAPWAVEIGEGVVWSGGFAVGAIRNGAPDAPRASRGSSTLAESGAVCSLVMLDADGRNGRMVRLSHVFGDAEPPQLASHGEAVLAALMEPNASGWQVRLARVRGEEVHWGAEIVQQRDESQATDMAVGANVAVVVWDEVASGPGTKRSDGESKGAIRLAVVDPTTLKMSTPVRVVSPTDTDAEVPKIVPRSGGFWLGWVARAPAAKLDGDSRFSGEPIDRRWLEVVALDDAAMPLGPAHRVTPQDGHVLGFDLEPLADGALLFAWRDDDTPSGSSGGQIATGVVRPGGSVQSTVLEEQGQGAGLPELLPGWLAVADVLAPTRLGAVAPTGELEDGLVHEPAFGHGEPVASTGDVLLVARPSGAVVDLTAMRCARRALRDPSSDADADAAPSLPVSEAGPGALDDRGD